jgi:hypothetical protein
MVVLGWVLYKMDPRQCGQAEEHILQGIRTLDEQKVKPISAIGHLALGNLYADTGQKEKALQSLKTAKAAFQEMRMDYWLRRTQEVLERIEG